ncbi:hypothetical protein Fmac_012611 [Flemingia macrophylla]|uniref:Uncharacterized protein n=1 Tax=Flemingia macrophylla TaxID=520843 RepID=A0ABD1MSY7_9FABA
MQMMMITPPRLEAKLRPKLQLRRYFRMLIGADASCSLFCFTDFHNGGMGISFLTYFLVWVALFAYVLGGKTGQPAPFRPDPLLARRKWGGAGWPAKEKRAENTSPPRQRASWWAGGLTRQEKEKKKKGTAGAQGAYQNIRNWKDSRESNQKIKYRKSANQEQEIRKSCTYESTPIKEKWKFGPHRVTNLRWGQSREEEDEDIWGGRGREGDSGSGLGLGREEEDEDQGGWRCDESRSASVGRVVKRKMRTEEGGGVTAQRRRRDSVDGSRRWEEDEDGEAQLKVESWRWSGGKRRGFAEGRESGVEERVNEGLGLKAEAELRVIRLAWRAGGLDKTATDEDKNHNLPFFQPKPLEVLVPKRGNIEIGDQQSNDESKSEAFENRLEAEMSVLKLVGLGGGGVHEPGAGFGPFNKGDFFRMERFLSKAAEGDGHWNFTVEISGDSWSFTSSSKFLI